MTTNEQERAEAQTQSGLCNCESFRHEWHAPIMPGACTAVVTNARFRLRDTEGPVCERCYNATPESARLHAPEEYVGTRHPLDPQDDTRGDGDDAACTCSGAETGAEHAEFCPMAEVEDAEIDEHMPNAVPFEGES